MCVAGGDETWPTAIRPTALVTRRTSVGQRLLHVDAPVAVLRPAPGFDVAEPCIDGLVFGHGLVRDQGHPVELAAGGFLLGEFHEGTAEPAALSAGIYGDVLDIQVPVTGAEGQDGRDGRAGDPGRAGLDRTSGRAGCPSASGTWRTRRR